MSTITVDDREFQNVCAALIARGSRLRPLLAEIGFELVRSTQDRFDDQIGPDGLPWVDLRPATWKRKRSNKMLVERGYLRGGIHSDAEESHVDVIADRVYAAIHQFGGTADMPAGAAAIPARPYLGVSFDDSAMVLRAAREYLQDALAGRA